MLRNRHRFFVATGLYLDKTGGMKMLFHYYKAIHSFNIPFSLLAGLFGLMGHDKMGGFLYGFILSLFTGGFLLAVFFFGLAYENRYYFYYNKGFSKLQLIGGAYLLNVVAIAVYGLIKYISA